MRLSFFGVCVLACSPLLAQAPKSDACAAWAIDGYRPDMPREEALAVRPASPLTYLSFDVRDPGRFSGGLFFDTAGKLQEYLSRREGSASKAEIIAVLKAKLGEPDAEDSVVKTFNGSGKMTVWTSAACEAAIVVVEERRGQLPDETFVSVGFQRRSEADQIAGEKERLRSRKPPA